MPFGPERRSAILSSVPSKPSRWASVAAAIDDIATMLLAWQERARQRRELLALDDRELHDIGLGRADAAGEGDKPFWRA
jgi:uncharacterized protein YjiS (DUF1127 family)